MSQAGQAPAAADIKNKDKLVSYNHTVIIYIYLHTCSLLNNNKYERLGLDYTGR